MNVTADALRAFDPADADALFAAGINALNGGLEEQVLPILEAGAARHSGDARIWQALGLAHRKREDLEPAVAAFARAAALAPADGLIAHGLARASLEAGLPAVDLFERALRLAPSDDGIYLGWLAAQYAEGRIDEAISMLELQLRRHPTWLSGHATLCRLRWLRGERESFAASYEAAIAAAPRDLAIWREWADALTQAEQYDAVLALVARARAATADPHTLDAHETIAVAEKGEIAAADRLFAAMGPIGDVSVATRYLRHLLRAGRPDRVWSAAEPWLDGPDANMLWPYVATAWRLTGDSRWHWLEGDERLVGIYDLGAAIPSLDALAERLRSLHLATGQPFDQSVRGGTQTDGPLFSRIEPEIRALRAAIVAAVERHIAQLPPPEKPHPTRLARTGPVRFAGSWSVRLPGSGFHSNHIHPAGWLSSAFYVALPEAMGAGDEGWLTLGAPQAELGLALAPFRKIEPRPGRLVLFPSTMWHGTIPFAAGERLTVAFDVARPGA